MARPRRAHDAQAFLDEAASDQVRSQHIFEPGPNLLRVGNRHSGLFRSLGPCADQQARLILVGVDATRVEVIAQARSEIVVVDGPQRLLDMFGREEIAEPGKVRMPLTKDLVGQAAGANLIFYLVVLVGPISLHKRIAQYAGLAPLIEWLQRRSLAERELLLEIAAVKQIGVDICAALRRQRIAL